MDTSNGSLMSKLFFKLNTNTYCPDVLLTYPQRNHLILYSAQDLITQKVRSGPHSKPLVLGVIPLSDRNQHIDDSNSKAKGDFDFHRVIYANVLKIENSFMHPVDEAN